MVKILRVAEEFDKMNFMKVAKKHPEVRFRGQRAAFECCIIECHTVRARVTFRIDLWG